MPQVRLRVNVYSVEYDCDAESCDGKVIFTGKSKPGIDPKQPLLFHVCNKCHKVYELKGMPYPRQELEPANELELSQN